MLWGTIGDAIARKPNFTRRGQNLAREQIEEGGLARSVGADHGEELAFRDSHRNVIDGFDSAEISTDAINYKQASGACLEISGHVQAPNERRG
jgi:hypothetical protein